jgi:hypothetical protein
MFDFSRASFRLDPYPIGITAPVFDEDVYQTMVAAYPDERTFKTMGAGYVKCALSERCRPDLYRQVVTTSPIWRVVHAAVKDAGFVRLVFGLLASHGLPIPDGAAFSTRFEFSSMPANGGMIAPHTDIPSKVVTLIVPMLRSVEEWDPEWGGGTDVLRPWNDDVLLQDYRAPLDAFERVTSYSYVPNQCCIFLKSERSWHSVGPMTGPAGVWRRSLTINIERAA